MPLQDLALQRFVYLLSCVNCTQDHAISEIYELARNVYDSKPAVKAEEEPVRRTVLQLVVITYEHLARSEMEDLICLGGSFALDVTRRNMHAAYEWMEALKGQNRQLQARFEQYGLPR